MKKILLLGGTGAMGEPLQKYLVEAGYKVYVTSRKEHRSDTVSFIKGNAHNVSFLKNILNSQYFDSIVDFMVYKTDEFDEVIKTILPHTNQYIFISSARVYAPSDSLITEDSPRLLNECKDEKYLATNEYALSKARQEDILFSSGYTNWTIVRPSLTYNTDRLQYPLGELNEWLPRTLNGNSVVIPREMMDKYTTLSYGDDVSFAISKLVCNDKALGQTIHIAGAEAVTWQEVMNSYGFVLKAEKQIDLKIKLINGYEKTSKELGRFYQIKYARAISRRFDNSKLLSLIGNVEFMSAKEGLIKCLSEHLNKGSKIPEPTPRITAYFDKLAHEKTPLKSFSTFKSKIKYVLLRYLYL